MRELRGPTGAGRLRAVVLDHPTFGGSLLGLVFWTASLSPTFVPRPWAAQSVVSAVCVAIGYALGGLLERIVVRLRLPAGGDAAPGARSRHRARLALTLGWLVGVAGGAVLWVDWQNDQRRVMGMPELGWVSALAMVVTAAVATWLLVVVGRAIGSGTGALLRVGRKRLPGALGAPTAVLLVIALVVLVVGGLGFRGLSAVVDAHYGSINEQTEADVVRPESASVSGSPASLVRWQSLGRTGREFVAGVTTPDELEEFHGAADHPVDPVRAYVGLLSADSLKARAELAVRELVRAGGFDRKVLVVWVPTGTGWMIDEAAEALEQLYDGDSAIVGIQYSYLPSLFSVIMQPGLAVHAGTALFNAVEAHWKELPADHRPKLLVFGKSLGTAGVEAPFAAADAESSVGNLLARTDGALIVGAKHGNPIRTQLTDERDPGSQVWRPVFHDGRSVRFLTRSSDQPLEDPSWSHPRIVYLQHPSDPVPFWGLDALWRPPDWMHRPRGYAVPDQAYWFPVVSAVQAACDQIYQLSPPPGFGHDYATEYAMGWVMVLPPDGWTDADTARMERFLDHGAPEESES